LRQPENKKRRELSRAIFRGQFSGVAVSGPLMDPLLSSSKAGFEFE